MTEGRLLLIVIISAIISSELNTNACSINSSIGNSKIRSNTNVFSVPIADRYTVIVVSCSTNQYAPVTETFNDWTLLGKSQQLIISPVLISTIPTPVTSS